MRNAVIVAAARTAVGKAPKGTLRTTRPDDMAAEVIKAVVAARRHRRQGNRGCRAGLRLPGGGTGHEPGAHRRPARRPARMTTAARPSTASARRGLQSIAVAAQQIMAGMGDVDHRRRRREHVAGADDRQQVRAQPLPGGGISGRLPRHGPDGRERGASSTRSPARTRMPLPCAATSGRRRPRRRASSTPRSCRWR